MTKKKTMKNIKTPNKFSWGGEFKSAFNSGFNGNSFKIESIIVTLSTSMALDLILRDFIIILLVKLIISSQIVNVIYLMLIVLLAFL